MPTTRAIAGSSTPARIIAPSRVRSSSAHSAAANDHGDHDHGEPVGRETPRPRRDVAPRSAAGVSIEIGSPPHTIRQTSAIMKERPKVTSTCASSAPGRRRSSSRSTSPPKHGDAEPAERSRPARSRRPSAIRLDAEIGAQHEERAVRQVRDPHQPEDQREAGGQQEQQAAERDAVDRQQPEIHARRSLRGRPPDRSALQRRIVARVDRLRQEPLLVVGPELADVRVGLDRRVDELAVLALAAADVEVADDVAEMVEVERPARRVGEADTRAAPR